MDHIAQPIARNAVNTCLGIILACAYIYIQDDYLYKAEIQFRNFAFIIQKYLAYVDFTSQAFARRATPGGDR